MELNVNQCWKDNTADVDYARDQCWKDNTADVDYARATKTEEIRRDR